MTTGKPPVRESEPINPEEQCISALLDMHTVTKGHEGYVRGVTNFYAAVSAGVESSPNDLSALLTYRDADSDALGASSPEWAKGKVVGSVSVSFKSSTGRLEHTLLNIDFVRTDEDGLRAFVKDFEWIGHRRVPNYVSTLDGAQLSALADDATEIRQHGMELDMERMKLGPLTEEADEFGRRNFHIGDVLGIMLGRSLSARGLEGNVDILRYLRGGQGVGVHQVNELRELFAPKLLERYGKQFEPYFDELRAAPDYTTVYSILNRIQSETGISMLAVDEAAPSPLKHESHEEALHRLFPEVADKQLDIILGEPDTDEDNR